LPCYLADNVDGQRGRGVYQESIDVLQKLNALGYGHPDSGLTLDLVYNPTGYNLPPAQEALEEDYKQYLEEHFGIVFNRLFTITNMPIKRFEHALRRDGEYDGYMAKLSEAHNMTNVDAVMCRYLVSVGWRGSVYDCDFNQMLQLSLDPEEHGPGWDEHVVEAEARKLWDFTPEELIGRSIRTGGHCFGCTAGAGSSCTGSLG
jgi:radical SAM/Cys-rich protein